MGPKEIIPRGSWTENGGRIYVVSRHQYKPIRLVEYPIPVFNYSLDFAGYVPELDVGELDQLDGVPLLGDCGGDIFGLFAIMA